MTADVVVFPRLTEADAAVSELEPAETFCRLVDALRGPCTPDSMGNLAALAARCPATTLDAPDLATSERLLDASMAATRSQPASFEPVDSAELAAAGFGNDVGAFRFGDDVALWSSTAGKTVHIREMGRAARRSSRTHRAARVARPARPPRLTHDARPTDARREVPEAGRRRA